MEPAVFDDFTARWRDAGFASQQEAVMHALRLCFWEADDGSKAEIPMKFRPYMDRLARLLSGDNSDAIEVVTAMLDFASKQGSSPRKRSGK
jgi:hypothetical protein